MAKRQRLRPDPIFTPADLKAAQQVFREWCGDNGLVIDVFAAADLCQKIANAIACGRSNPPQVRQPDGGTA